jgi:pSer/pThr/pTyr-binding forkhead associated (FHA) protein
MPPRHCKGTADAVGPPKTDDSRNSATEKGSWPPFPTFWHDRYVTSSSLERLAQAAYEAHRNAYPESLPPWEDATGQEQQAWRAAASAIAGLTGSTVVEAPQRQSLVIQVGQQRHTFRSDFSAGRQGNLVIDDGHASSHHARFQVVRSLWYIEDAGSTNGTWLNGRRIHAAQLLKKGDKIRIGHTVVIVVST